MSSPLLSLPRVVGDLVHWISQRMAEFDALSWPHALAYLVAYAGIPVGLVRLYRWRRRILRRRQELRTRQLEWDVQQMRSPSPHDERRLTLHGRDG